MSQLVESIKIFNGKVYNIAGHEKRANLARLELFGRIDPLNIGKNINIPAEFSTGLVKDVYKRQDQYLLLLWLHMSVDMPSNMILLTVCLLLDQN